MSVRRGIASGIAVSAIALLGILTPVVPAYAAMESVVEKVAVDLPTILGEPDTVLYRKIFDLQDKADWRAADHLIKQLKDRRLMGRVLYQRYMHPTGWRSSYRQLADWMKHYADQPGAVRVYKLARRRKPVKSHPPRRPRGPASGIYAEAERKPLYRSTKRRSRAQRSHVRHVQRDIRKHLLRGQGKRAAEHLADRKHMRYFDPVEVDLLKAKVAAVLFRSGYREQAYAMAHGAVKRVRKYTVQADWVAGISAWSLGQYAEAGRHFEAMITDPAASDRDIASGAFWGARAALADRRPSDVNRLLAVAATRPRTFYGLVAARQLGVASPFSWTPPPIDPSTFSGLSADPAIGRAVALVQVGQNHWAASEIRRLFPSADGAKRMALLGLAAHVGVPSAELSLARAVLGADRQAFDTALYPLPPWQPRNGFTVDRALVYAFMRQESAFKTKAKSRDGARGLMQLMPRTASFIARDRSLRGRNRRALFTPELNLDLGQRYLKHLMETEGVEENLVMLAAAYNGGPGNLRKWLRRMKRTDDPLLFVESLPSRETRKFIRRVLGNFWIYRDRLNRQSPSLDAVAVGQWPNYTTLDAEVRTAQTTR